MARFVLERRCVAGVVRVVVESADADAHSLISDDARGFEQMVRSAMVLVLDTAEPILDARHSDRVAQTAVDAAVFLPNTDIPF